jgi:plasmid maintenance system antidote protein VapI
MEASEILNKLLIYSNLNAKAFSEKIGLYRPQAIYDIQKGKTRTISPAMKDKIVSVFSEVNTVWLLTGEGEMLKNNQQIGDVTSSTIIGANVNGNGIKITHNDLSGMIELQKGYQDMIKKSQEQIDRLIGIIEQNVKFP